MSVLLRLAFILREFVFRRYVGNISQGDVVINCDKFRRFKVDRVVYRAHFAHIEQLFDYFRGSLTYFFAEYLDRNNIRIHFGMVDFRHRAGYVALRFALLFIPYVAVLVIAVLVYIALFDKIALGKRLLLFVFLGKTVLLLFISDALSAADGDGRRHNGLRSAADAGTPVESALSAARRTVGARREFTLTLRAALRTALPSAVAAVQKLRIYISFRFILDGFFPDGLFLGLRLNLFFFRRRCFRSLGRGNFLVGGFLSDFLFFCRQNGSRL